MIDEVLPGGIAGRIERAITKMEERMPPAKVVLETYGEVILERARLREGLPPLTEVPVSPPDPFRFSQGMPLLTEDTLIRFTHSMGITHDRMLSVLEKAFPKINAPIQKLKRALEEGQLILKDCMEAMLNGREEKMDQIALRLGVESLILKFILGQLMKPFIERLGESLKPLVGSLSWHKGYCPICGSLPELGYLNGNEGQRWLRCSLCAHEWRFARTKCPFCENDDQKKMEFYFIEDRSYERAELCYQCKRYLVSIDLRSSPDEVVLDVAALGMVYLDILAQGKGFLPMAFCAWNVVSPRDISSVVQSSEKIVVKGTKRRLKKSSEIIPSS